MNALIITIAIKVGATTVMVPAQCSAPRDIGGGQTVRTCEVVKAVRK